MDLDPAYAFSRIQFAVVVSCHIIFPAFTIGLAASLATIEGVRLGTGHPIYRRECDFWLKVFGLSFGMGVVSEIVMAFQGSRHGSAFYARQENTAVYQWVSRGCQRSSDGREVRQFDWRTGRRLVDIVPFTSSARKTHFRVVTPITREGFPGESIRICEVPRPSGAASADSLFIQIAALPEHPRDPDAAVGFRRATETCATCGGVQVGTKSG